MELWLRMIYRAFRSQGDTRGRVHREQITPVNALCQIGYRSALPPYLDAGKPRCYRLGFWTLVYLKVKMLHLFSSLFCWLSVSIYAGGISTVCPVLDDSTAALVIRMEFKLSCPDGLRFNTRCERTLHFSHRTAPRIRKPPALDVKHLSLIEIFFERDRQVPSAHLGATHIAQSKRRRLYHQYATDMGYGGVLVQCC